MSARAALAAIALAAVPAAAAGASAFPYALRPERARYLLGEPVYLRMEGKAARPPALETGSVALSIRAPGGAERIYVPPLRIRSRPEPAGSGGVRYARLIAEAGGWVFPGAGRYVLQLRVPAGSEGLGGSGGGLADAGRLSDTVAVEIVPPADSADLRAYASIAKAPGEYALAVYLEGGDHLKAGMTAVREAAAFPNAYARAASMVLCSGWSQDYFGRGSGAPRRSDAARALAWARWDQSGGPYAALRCAYRLRQALPIWEKRDPRDPALARVRERLRAFEGSLTADERMVLASF